MLQLYIIITIIIIIIIIKVTNIKPFERGLGISSSSKHLHLICFTTDQVSSQIPNVYNIHRQLSHLSTKAPLAEESDINNNWQCSARQVTQC
jgi:hypothetical protein